MVKFFYCRLKVALKSYPDQKLKCLKLIKSYPEKKQYIDFALSAFWCFFVLVKPYRKKKIKSLKLA